MVRGEFLECFDLGLGGRHVLLSEQQRDHAGVGGHEVLADCQDPGKRLARRRKVILGKQQVSLELPGLIGIGRLGQDLVEQPQGAVEIALIRLESGLHEERRAIVGHGLQRRFQRRFELLLVALPRIGYGDRCLQIRCGRRLGQIHRGVLRGELAVRAGEVERARQYR